MGISSRETHSHSNPSPDAVKHGPWYWVFFRPAWEVIAAPVGSADESLDHPQLWTTAVVPRLVDFYKIPARQRAALNEAPYALPRGRVAFAPGRMSRCFLWHGNDLPKIVPIQSAFADVIAAFELASSVESATVSARFDEHERILRHDQSVLEALIGPIDFRPHPILKFPTALDRVTKKASRFSSVIRKDESKL